MSFCLCKEKVLCQQSSQSNRSSTIRCRFRILKKVGIHWMNADFPNSDIFTINSVVRNPNGPIYPHFWPCLFPFHSILFWSLEKSIVFLVFECACISSVERQRLSKQAVQVFNTLPRCFDYVKGVEYIRQTWSLWNNT
jgi:hypothetical protein